MKEILKKLDTVTPKVYQKPLKLFAHLALFFYKVKINCDANNSEYLGYITLTTSLLKMAGGCHHNTELKRFLEARYSRYKKTSSTGRRRSPAAAPATVVALSHCLPSPAGDGAGAGAATSGLTPPFQWTTTK